MDLAIDYRPDAYGTPSENDLIVSDTGDLGVVDGGQEIGQLILMRLRWFLGEWFLDTTQGVPWRQQVLGQTSLTPEAEQRLQNTILSTPGVQQIAQWQASVDARQRVLRVAFCAIVTGGTVYYNGPLATGLINA